jgi:hypothetical protein
MASKLQVTLDYKKLTIDDMVDYIINYDKTPEAVAFIKSFYEEKPANVERVGKVDSNGKPVMITNKKGEKVQKKETRAIGTETKQVYNILRAKSEFYKRYKNVIRFENAPKEKKTDSISKALSRLDELKF